MRAATKVECVVFGVILALAAWLAIVPWDLSVVDKEGFFVDRSGDHIDARTVSALLVLTALYVLVALLWVEVPIGWVSIGTSMTWMVIFAWRASVSRVVGANMWIAGLIVWISPLAVAASASVWLAAFLRRSKFRN